MTAHDVALAVQAEMIAAGIGGTYAIPSIIRKKPAKFSYDPSVQFNICPAEDTGAGKPFAFKTLLFRHRVDVVLVAPSNNSMADNMSEYAGVIDSLMSHFGRARSWAPAGTLHVRCRARTYFDRKWLEVGYDYLAVTVELDETRAI